MIDIAVMSHGGGLAIRCPACPHRPGTYTEDDITDGSEWVDSDEATYFEGESIDQLMAFLRRHGAIQ